MTRVLARAELPMAFYDALLEIALNAARGHNPEGLVESALGVLIEGTAFERGMVGHYVFSAAEGVALSVLAIQGTAWNSATRVFFDEACLSGEGLASSSSLVGAVLRSGELVVEASKTPRGEAAPGRVVLGMPLMDADRLLGVIALEGRGTVEEATSLAEGLRPFLELCRTLLLRMSRSGGATALDLQRELEFSRAVLDSIADAVLTLDLSGAVLAVNRAAERIFGYAQEELIGRPVASLFAVSGANVMGTMATGQVKLLGIDRDAEGRRQDGTLFPAQVGICKERFLEGRLVTWIIRDVSEIRSLERDLQRFFTISLDMVLIMGRDGVIRRANPAWMRQLGYAPDRLIGRSLWELIPERDRGAFTRSIERLWVDDRPFEGLEAPCRDHRGAERWLEWSVVPARQEGVLYVAASDITARRQAAEKSALLASIVDSSSDPIIGTAPDGTILSWNQAAERLYAFSAEEAVGRSIAVLQGTGPINSITSLIDQVMEGRPVQGVEMVHRRKSGSSVVVSLTISPIHHEERGVIGTSILVRDLTTAKEVDRLRASLRDKYRYDNVVGVSRSMQQVFQIIERVMNANAPVLLTGESGVGKEVLAKLLHFQSNRQNKPFVAVNCAAIPDELLESEMFGHEKGAFTGAVQRRVGRFEEAGDGTILLDEIGELDARMQAKLLRVLQERCFERVGSNRPIPVEARVVATTNRDLEVEIKTGVFREDLYYRLNVIRIQIPPLRERAEDIPSLIQLMLRRLREQESREIKRITPAALELLCAYPWPGNIRELENTIFRAGLVCPGAEIDVDSLPASITEARRPAPAPVPLPSSTPELLQIPAHLNLAEQEEYVIRQVFREVDGDVQQTIDRLGISRATLYRKLKKFGLIAEEAS